MKPAGESTADCATALRLTFSCLIKSVLRLSATLSITSGGGDTRCVRHSAAHGSHARWDQRT
eukprot:809641-Rhodomonas_salina.2